MKKPWEKPVLLVLVRSNPEESLTLACKGPTGGGPNITGCQLAVGAGGCEDITTS